MTVQSLKTSLHHLIDQIEDPTLLAAVYKILSTGQDDWGVALDPAEANEIREGIADLDDGKVISHDQVMEEVKAILKLS